MTGLIVTFLVILGTFIYTSIMLFVDLMNGYTNLIRGCSYTFNAVTALLFSLQVPILLYLGVRITQALYLSPLGQ